MSTMPKATVAKATAKKSGAKVKPVSKAPFYEQTPKPKNPQERYEDFMRDLNAAKQYVDAVALFVRAMTFSAGFPVIDAAAQLRRQMALAGNTVKTIRTSHLVVYARDLLNAGLCAADAGKIILAETVGYFQEKSDESNEWTSVLTMLGQQMPSLLQAVTGIDAAKLVGSMTVEDAPEEPKKE